MRRTRRSFVRLSALLIFAACVAEINMFQTSLRDAEQAFSDSAQVMGLGPAFEFFGTADAMNMGGGERPGFVMGSAAIGREVSSGGPAEGSAVTWSADRAIVSSTGDLGVTFEMIMSKEPGPDGARPAGIPFFTIWRRATVSDHWRYIAE